MEDVSEIKPEKDKTVKPTRLNRERAAEIAEVSLSTIKRAIACGSLKSFKIGGSRFVLYKELVSWLGYDPNEPN
jgi:hypothetical protein